MSFSSVFHMFDQACERFDRPNAVMVKQDGAYKPRSHRFFRQRVHLFGRGLMTLDVKPGDHVALLAETRFEWAIADLGIMGAGAVTVPVYPTLTADQVAWILENSDAVGAVVSTREQAEKAAAAKSRLPKLRFVICMEEAGAGCEGVTAMADVEKTGYQNDNESEFIQRWQALKPEDLLTIIYTSGTTGHPKGVMLSHANLLSNVEACKALLPFTPEDVHLSHLPLCHVFERMAGYYSLINRGVCIAYAEDIRSVPQNMMEAKPTLIMSVPRLYEKIYASVLNHAKSLGFVKRAMFQWALKVGRQTIPYTNKGKPLPAFLARKWALADKLVHSKLRAKMGGRLSYAISGGAPLSREVGELFLSVGVRLREGYGLTETSPVLAFNLPEQNKPGTVGPPVEGVELSIAEDGEILARGPNIMRGYYKNPEATAEAIDEDGWFHTGDIGLMDEDGFLRITDRKKDIVITSGGKNIAPQPLENALKLSPLIEHAVILADQRPFVSALIMPPWETIADWAPKNNWPTDPEQLAAHPPFLEAMEVEVQEQMKDFAHYEKVKKFAVVPAQFSIEGGELTPSLKIRRRNVTEKYREIIDKLYGG